MIAFCYIVVLSLSGSYVLKYPRLYILPVLVWLILGLTEQLETVRAELELSREIFIKKTTEQSRHLAWVSAAIISTVSSTAFLW